MLTRNKNNSRQGPFGLLIKNKKITRTAGKVVLCMPAGYHTTDGKGVFDRFIMHIPTGLTDDEEKIKQAYEAARKILEEEEESGDS